MNWEFTESEHHLIEWLGPADGDIPGSLPSEFVDRNKLAAVIADRAPEKYGHLVNERLRRYSLEAVRELGSVLDRREIAYAVIKSVPIVPKPIGDVDVLVDDIETAETILAERSFAVASREPNKVVYEKYIDGTRVAIHLHAEISWEGVRYLDAAKILNSRRERQTEFGPVPVPAPEDELLITAAHMLFEQGNGRIIFLNMLEYTAHFERKKIDIDSMLATADEHHWRRPLERYLQSLDAIYQELYELSLNDQLSRFDVGGLADYNPLFKSWLFSVPILAADRLYRCSRSGSRNADLDFSNLFYTYFVDMVDVLAERHGITYTKQRLIRWLNTTSTD